MRKIYIYALYEDGKEEYRYIGKTYNLKLRLKEHIREAFSVKLPTHKINWIKSVINNGKNINIKCIEEANEDNWQEREKYWISKYDNLTNSTEGGECGRTIFYTMSYNDCKKLVQENFNIKSKSQWVKNTINLPNNIPINPQVSYLNRGWVSWGDFLGTNVKQDNLLALKYLLYDDAKIWIKNNLNINTIEEWKQSFKNNKIPYFIPNKPDKFYKNNRGWVSWGDFLNTGRIANKYKKYIFLPYSDACKLVIEHNITSKSQYIRHKFKNIPVSPDKYYKEWTTWGSFLGTNRNQDNKLSLNYITFNDATNWLRYNLSYIKTEKEWKIAIKEDKIPEFIPNHPELYYNRKDRGWLGWMIFLSK